MTIELDYGFKVCRVCLAPGSAVELISLLSGSDRMKWFRSISGVEVDVRTN